MAQASIKVFAPEEFNFTSPASTDGIFSVGGEFAVFPGFCDVHVHFREPGFSYKETIKSGSAAAAAGGYTSVCTMPNLNPVPDCLDNLTPQLELIKKDACINVYPFGSITRGEKGEALAAMDELAPYVCGFSDDGKGVQNEEMMLDAMKEAKRLGKVISAHCEDNSLLFGGYIHDGVYAKAHGHRGICSESEYLPIERDIALAEKTGCAYHVCHISCKESVELIREAKKRGADVTCETAPHYLTLCENDLVEDGRFKMNPPLRSEKDKEALIEGILDGTIDMIATDHAPHSYDEKSKGLEKSAFGISGIENAFSVLYTYLVRPGILTLDSLTRLLCVNPRRRFGLPFENSYTVFRLDECFTLNPENMVSNGKSTPYSGKTLYGKRIATSIDGKNIYG